MTLPLLPESALGRGRGKPGGVMFLALRNRAHAVPVEVVVELRLVVVAQIAATFNLTSLYR